MPRIAENRLTAFKVSRLQSPGSYLDGRGLRLVISTGRGRSWVFRYMIAGQSHEIGLGSARDVSLADAREQAADFRKSIRAGSDPAADRKEKRARVVVERARTMTFRQCAEAYMAANAAGWRNAKHRGQWAATLETYAYPLLGNLPVADIDIALVFKVIEPIWATKNETASRVRGRIGNVLDWATVSNFRQGENPATWRGRLDKLLPPRSRVMKVQHHTALPMAELPALVGRMREPSGISARALEFLILTAARTGEAIGATWAEIDFEAEIWTLSGNRMKAGAEHRVPLSPRALAIVRAMETTRISEFVFPGARREKSLSTMALDMLLRRLGVDATVHGFRSTFRDWASEETAYPSEAAEMALAHTVSNKVEAAYRRGDLLEKRRAMMGEWAAYCEPKCREKTQ
jgi:integrase